MKWPATEARLKPLNKSFNPWFQDSFWYPGETRETFITAGKGNILRPLTVWCKRLLVRNGERFYFKIVVGCVQRLLFCFSVNQ